MEQTINKPATFKATVCVVIIKNEKILIIERKKDGLWGVPAGKIDQNEDIIEAARREVKEEVGIDLSEFQDSDFLLSDVRIWHGTSEYIAITYILNDFQDGFGPELSTPVIMEPHKHTNMMWSSREDLDKLESEGKLFPNLTKIML